MSILIGMLWVCAKKGKSRLYLLLPFCFIVGLIRMDMECERIKRSEALHLEQSYSQAEGRVIRIEEKNKNMVVTIEPAYIHHKTGLQKLSKLLIYMDEDMFHQKNLKIGHRLRISGSYKNSLPTRNPGQFDSRLYYRSLGLEYSMYADQVVVTERSVNHYKEGLRRIRLYGENKLEQTAQPEDVGIMKAAVLGEKGDMASELKEMYQKNGISHLLAISGLHVSILGLGFYQMLRKCGAGYGMSGLVCGCLLISYGILTGESPSVIRAVIMLLCQCLAQYLGRTYDLVSGTCLAALLLLLQFPYGLFQGGVQLSFGAVLGVGALGPYLSRTMEARGKVGQVWLCSLAIQIVTYPLTLYHFFQYPVYGIFLNLLVIPFMAYVVYSGLLSIFLGSISLMLGIGAMGTAHYVLLWYQWLCEVFEKLPGYSLILGRPLWWQLAGYVGIIIAGLVMMSKVRVQKRPCILIGMVICLAVILLPLPIRDFRVTFLDVGQGDGILLRTSDAVILVDGGSTSVKDLGKYRLEPYLKSQGISQIDYAIVSHADKDHISGLLYLLEEERGIVIKNLLLPVLGKGDLAYEPLSKAALTKRCNVYYIAAGDSLEMGDLKLQCLYPGKEDMASDKNNQSSMILVSFGSFSMLLTGDMDEAGERKMTHRNKGLLPTAGVSVLKAGHHGSRTATSQELLDAIRPRWALLSYEMGNSYGHPHQEVVERLEDGNTMMWRTADSGAVTMSTDGEYIRWKMWIADHPNEN